MWKRFKDEEPKDGTLVIVKLSTNSSWGHIRVFSGIFYKPMEVWRDGIDGRTISPSLESLWCLPENIIP